MLIMAPLPPLSVSVWLIVLGMLLTAPSALMGAAAQGGQPSTKGNALAPQLPLPKEDYGQPTPSPPPATAAAPAPAPAPGAAPAPATDTVPVAAPSPAPVPKDDWTPVIVVTIGVFVGVLVLWALWPVADDVPDPAILSRLSTRVLNRGLSPDSFKITQPRKRGTTIQYVARLGADVDATGFKVEITPKENRS